MSYPLRSWRGAFLLALALLVCGPCDAQRAFPGDDKHAPSDTSRMRRVSPCDISDSAIPRSRSAAATVNLADCEDSASDPPSASGPSAAPGAPALDARLLMPSPAVPRDLQGLGKNGQSILAARAHVLEILATDNACTAWFRQGTANP